MENKCLNPFSNKGHPFDEKTCTQINIYRLIFSFPFMSKNVFSYLHSTTTTNGDIWFGLAVVLSLVYCYARKTFVDSDDTVGWKRLNLREITRQPSAIIRSHFRNKFNKCMIYISFKLTCPKWLSLLFYFITWYKTKKYFLKNYQYLVPKYWGIQPTLVHWTLYFTYFIA